MKCINSLDVVGENHHDFPNRYCQDSLWAPPLCCFSPGAQLGWFDMSSTFAMELYIYYICSSKRDVRMYVRMYVCIYVYMYVCIYVYMYVCIYVYMYICIYVYMWSWRGVGLLLTNRCLSGLGKVLHTHVFAAEIMARSGPPTARHARLWRKKNGKNMKKKSGNPAEFPSFSRVWECTFFPFRILQQFNQLFWIFPTILSIFWQLICWWWK